MLPINKKYNLAVGPLTFSVSSNIKAIHSYLEHHYDHCLCDTSDNRFIDYHVAIEHGPLYRRCFKPQASFKFNFVKPFKPLPLSQAHAMLEWGMNWVISSQANQFLILHAATLEKKGKGVIISAPSGSGKSTLCAYLVSQGWRLLSDELALVSPETLMLYGLGRPINLKNNSIELIKPFFSADQFSDVATDTHKGTVSLLKAPSESIKSANIPVKPSLIVFVSYNANEPCYIEPVEKCLALTEIIQNSFNFGLLNTHGFDCARRLVSQTQALYIEYNNFQACELALQDALDEEYQCDQAC